MISPTELALTACELFQDAHNRKPHTLEEAVMWLMHEDILNAAEIKVLVRMITDMWP